MTILLPVVFLQVKFDSNHKEEALVREGNMRIGIIKRYWHDIQIAINNALL